jgi:hypothetical protein
MPGSFEIILADVGGTQLDIIPDGLVAICLAGKPAIGIGHTPCDKHRQQYHDKRGSHPFHWNKCHSRQFLLNWKVHIGTGFTD